MANIYVSSASYAAVATWAASTAYTSTANGGRGSYVRQLATPATGSERVFRCTTSGTSLASEPTWTLTKNGTTTESGGPVWTECTGQEADQVSGTWKAPHARLANALAATWGAAGDTFYVGDNHSETQAAVMTLTSPGTAASPNQIYCVLVNGTVPPISSDLRTSATISTTGNNAMTIGGGYCYVRGISFNCGSGANGAPLSVASSGSWWSLLNCSLNKNGTANGFIIFGNLGGASVAVGLYLENTTLQFGSTGDGVIMRMVDFKWRKTANAITGTAFPTTFFMSSVSCDGTTLLDGIDISSLGSGTIISNFIGSHRRFIFSDCKLGNGATVMASSVGPGGAEAFVSRSDSSGTNYRNEKYQYAGTQTVEVKLVRDNGASDGSTSLSWKISTTANAKWILPFESYPIAIWNPTILSNVTATIEGFFQNSATLPKNDDIWLESSYLGSSGSPLASISSGTKADGLAIGDALSASMKSWDSLATSRANSTSYSVGDYCKVASNPGRLFYCRTAGTSAGSEPGGYSSAVDGGDITDGSTVFRAVMRFSMTITMSSPQPAQAGVLYATVKVGRASSVFYVDPLIVLS